MTLKKLRNGLIAVIAIAVMFRVIVWAIEPAVPILLSILGVVLVLGTIYHRSTRW